MKFHLESGRSSDGLVGYLVKQGGVFLLFPVEAHKTIISGAFRVDDGDVQPPADALAAAVEIA